MKYAIVFLLTTKLVGCQKYLIELNSKKVQSIKIEAFGEDKSLNQNIEDKKAIEYLVKELNNSNRELSVFKPEYELTINFDDGSTLPILCNGNRIKINGLTYQLKKTIKEILKSD